MTVKDFPKRTGSTNSDLLDDWLDRLGMRQNIDDQIEVTDPASSDEVLIFDASANSARKTSLSNFSKGLGAIQATSINFGDTSLSYYKEGTWTPALSFDTVGDLSVAYSVQVGRYTRIGRIVNLQWNLATSSFTYTTASGNLRLTGFPFALASVSGLNACGSSSWSTINKAGYTHINVLPIANQTYGLFWCSGAGLANAAVAAADAASGSAMACNGTISYSV